MTNNPFDYVNQINTGKKNIMRGTEDDAQAEKDYNPFLVNRALSYFPDTVSFAADMNMHYDIPKRAQFEYLLNSIRPRKRFAKWAKKTDDEELVMICAAYGCNRNVAKTYLSLLSKEQLTMIKEQQEKGGIVK